MAATTEYMRQWREKNPDYMRRWRAANPGRAKGGVISPEKAREYTENYREIGRANARRWHKSNRGKSNELKARRRAAQLQRTPHWLSKVQRAEITQLYELAARLTQITGVAHHVDHIVPLRGRTVSGLHVPWNLQVLRAAENLKKSNRVQSEGHLGMLSIIAPSL